MSDADSAVIQAHLGYVEKDVHELTSVVEHLCGEMLSVETLLIALTKEIQALREERANVSKGWGEK